MIPYEEVLTHLIPGSLITFKEYKLDRHENRKLVYSIERVGVYKVIPANTTLTKAELDNLFSTELSEEDYLQLAKQNCFRFVVITAVQDNNFEYTVISFTKDYYNTGLQEISFPNLDLDTKFVKRIPIRVVKDG